MNNLPRMNGTRNDARVVNIVSGKPELRLQNPETLTVFNLCSSVSPERKQASSTRYSTSIMYRRNARAVNNLTNRFSYTGLCLNAPVLRFCRWFSHELRGKAWFHLQNGKEKIQCISNGGNPFRFRWYLRQSFYSVSSSTVVFTDEYAMSGRLPATFRESAIHTQIKSTDFLYSWDIYLK